MPKKLGFGTAGSLAPSLPRHDPFTPPVPRNSNSDSSSILSHPGLPALHAPSLGTGGWQSPSRHPPGSIPTSQSACMCAWHFVIRQAHLTLPMPPGWRHPVSLSHPMHRLEACPQRPDRRHTNSWKYQALWRQQLVLGDSSRICYLPSLRLLH